MATCKQLCRKIEKEKEKKNKSAPALIIETMQACKNESNNNDSWNLMEKKWNEEKQLTIQRRWNI